MLAQFHLLPKEQALEQARHQAEVEAVLRKSFPDKPEEATRYFSLCEEYRGVAATKRLRDDTRAAWIERVRAQRQR